MRKVWLFPLCSDGDEGNLSQITQPGSGRGRSGSQALATEFYMQLQLQSSEISTFWMCALRMYLPAYEVQAVQVSTHTGRARECPCAKDCRTNMSTGISIACRFAFPCSWLSQCQAVLGKSAWYLERAWALDSGRCGLNSGLVTIRAVTGPTSALTLASWHLSQNSFYFSFKSKKICLRFWICIRFCFN